MTTTLSPISRETIGAYPVVDRGARPIIIRIDRDSLFFRVKGKRELYRLPIETAFRYAVAFDVMPAELPRDAPPLEHVRDDAKTGRRHFKTADDAGQMTIDFDIHAEAPETEINAAAKLAAATA